MRSSFFLCLLLLMTSASYADDSEPDHAIHEELRGVFRSIEDAINARRYDDLAPYFHERLRVTTINQEIISARPEIAGYFNRWFGPGGYLKSLEIHLNADALTELSADKTFGVVRGSGIENYILADGRNFDMKTRWTATVIKDTDGAWRILALHIGTNFLDNPILSAAENALRYFTAGGVAVGLAIGAIGGWLFGRRKRTQ